VKRLSTWAKLKLLRSARRSMKARQRRKARRLAAAKGIALPGPVAAEKSLISVTFYRRGKTRRGFAHAKMPMPEHFCLVENHEDVATFLSELRHSLDVSGTKYQKLRVEGALQRQSRRRNLLVDSYVDFTTIKTITPASALVLASEFDRAMNVFDAPADWLRAIDINRWDSGVLRTLDDVGFLSLLGVEQQKTDVSVQDGIYTVPFISGAKVHGSMIDRLIRGMATLADSEGVVDSETLLNRSRVYDGLGEAVQNVEDHAYPLGGTTSYPVVKKWWMTGAVEPGKKRFTISIYDHGVSIPASLPKWKRFSDFRAAFAAAVGLEYNAAPPEQHDGQTIAQAVQLGQTSTEEPWRGKGLPVIRDIIENCKAGTVQILSRNGQYACSTGKQPNHCSYKAPITGTLIEWDLFL
jgi:hypothetical protein